MKNIFKSVGFILLYLFIFTSTQAVLGLFFGIFYVLKTILQDGNLLLDPNALTQDIIEYTANSLPLILILSFIVSTGFYILIVKLRKIRVSRICSFRKIKLNQLVVVTVLTLSINIIINAVLSLLHYSGAMDQTFEQYEGLMESITGSSNTLMLLLSVGILIPILEEVVFRGLIFFELKKITPIWAAVLLQALLFGIAHLNIIQSSYAFVLGVLMGLLYVWTKSFWAPLIIHVVLNSSSVILSRSDVLSGYFFSLPALIFSILFTIIGTAYLYKERLNN